MTPVAIFEPPSAQGGYLSLVRTTVDETIARVKGAGGTVGVAATFLAQGDPHKAAGKF